MNTIVSFVKETISSNESSLSSSSTPPEETGSGGALYMILAILSPIMFSLTNLVDKLAVSGRVKHMPGYLIMIGVFDCIAAAIIAACCDWSAETLAGTRAIDFIFPAISAIFWAGTIYFYFGGILLADASIVIGVENVYPLLVVILSAIFLHERIASLGYLGCVLLVIGAVALSLNPIGMIRSKCKKTSKESIIAEPEPADSLSESQNTTSKPATSNSEGDKEAGCAPGVSCWFPCGTWFLNCVKFNVWLAHTKSASFTEIRNEAPRNETPSVFTDDESDESGKEKIKRVDSGKSPDYDLVMAEKKQEEEEKKHHRHHRHHSHHRHHHPKKEDSKKQLESSDDNEKDDEIDEKLENAIELDVIEVEDELEDRDHEKENVQQEKKEEHNCFLSAVAFCQKHRGSKLLLISVLVPMAISAALYGFMAKVSTSGLGPFNVCAIDFFVFGLLMIASALITPLEGAKYFVSEFKRNWLFCLLSDAFTLAGQIFMIVALSGMPASIATCLTGIQPFCVLCLERVFRIASDSMKECLTDKLIPVFFIVGGVIVLSLLSV